MAGITVKVHGSLGTTYITALPADMLTRVDLAGETECPCRYCGSPAHTTRIHRVRAARKARKVDDATT